MNSNLSAPNDEIDLGAMMRNIWRGKWIIAIFMILGAVGGFFYSQKQGSEYSMEVYPPTAGDLSALTIAFPYAPGVLMFIPEPKDVFGQYMRDVQSIGVQRDFLQAMASDNGGSTTVTSDQVKDFYKTLKISPTKKNAPLTGISITMRGDDANDTAQLLEAYVKFAGKVSEARLRNEVLEALAQQLTATRIRLESGEVTAKLALASYATKLKTAYATASALGLESEVTTEIDSGLLAGELLYRRGTRVLKAQLDAAEQPTQATIDAYFPEAPGLRGRLKYVEQARVAMETAPLSTYRSDTMAASNPASKQLLLIVLGLFGGIIFGTCITLIVCRQKNRLT
ncbi:Wzz/FepE/Etk N-terminal domain-containing protein [Achromobacter xylosoxidans]|uniref:Wzz/FepE/Etk N-terminal domain-containing protein n=2 Tax=Alcaligenes xylosoxydans xylosoxydans TaxID=85698 RepID=UPI0006C25AA5|nr:Wzz/FepE/Etk N-terminal domain-containing protein [Achromobacter xylosoxidans]MCH4573420.1 Wzz/FepE/Etk N-terminal domain-containing protein [Achromobacter xylosoxidans]MDD7987669.1 Wzz/FepE/Etk N-terminal domain-containing protein [Achromobacter xylosoxidans]NEV03447.1 hypothetical protein [Achromobacter xylosoxidans]CUJ28228.1 lipopolysaccharide biosynthesis protein WzzE [Achromobacter xylosoxidans]CUK02017.1 lipopolysaccharide biosynthesis protein WzzE [Achromobacter xylosoxidans]